MKTLKKLFTGKTLALFSAIGTFFLAGCASPFGKENRAYLYVAENESITCLGQTFKMSDEVAAFLEKKGATPATVIIIVVQGEIPDFYLKSIVYACGHKGFTQVYIRGNLHANATVSEQGRQYNGKMINGSYNNKRDQTAPKQSGK